jgi:DNA invertase Pin-like site-specific DNA recombinase
MAGLAEYESAQIGRRVKAGMERAKAQGKRISRPLLAPRTRQQIQKLRQQGHRAEVYVVTISFFLA